MPTKKVQARKSKTALNSSTSPSPALTNKVGPETLLPTEEIIKIARSRGVDFGPGDPFERIRYYIKHGMLPHQIRKSTVKFDSQSSKNSEDSPFSTLTLNSSTPIGHLPSWTVDRLVRIDRLFKRGLSYPQIAKKLKRHEASRARRVVAQKQQPIPPPAKPHLPLKTKLTFFAAFALASLLLISLGSIIIDSYETDYYLALQKDKSYKRANIKVLGIKDTADTFWGKFLTATSNLVDAIARPFGNLAAVFSGELSPQVIYQPGQLPQELAPTDHQDTSTQVSTNLTDSTDLTAGGDLLIQNLTVTGQTTLGTGFTDYLILKGAIKSDIVPATTKTYNLGTGGERWKSGYFSDNVYIGDENRIGVTGMNVKGSMYLETRSGGSIYLNPDSNNVYIGNNGNLTVAGTITSTSSSGSAFNCTDCIDFDDIANSPTLDESTDINLSTLDLFVDLTSSGVFAIRDVATAYWTFDDDSTVDVVFPAAGTIGIDASTTANTTTAGVIDLNVSSATDLNRALDVAYTHTATGATTSYSMYNAWSSTAVVIGATVSQTGYGIYNTATKTGADTATGTYSLYGLYSTASNTGRTDAGTVNTYGAYFDATGDASGTASVFGVYIADVSGGDTNVGLCFDCDGTWTASTVAAGIQFGTDANAVTLYRSANDVLRTGDGLTVDLDLIVTGGDITLGTTSIFSGGDTASLNNIDAIDATTETTLEAAIDIAGDISGTGLGSVAIGADKILESHLKAVDAAADEECLTREETTGDFEWQSCGSFDLTSTHTFAAGDAFVIDASTTANTTTAGVIDLNVSSATDSNRGLDIAYTHTATGATTSYSVYNAWASTAVVAGASVSQTGYGIYNTATKTGADTATGTYSLYGLYSTASNTGRTDAGTVNTYGAYFDATGDASGTASVFGLYLADVSGGDTNVALCFDCDGTWTASTVAAGIQFGTDANAVNLYRNGSDSLKTDDDLEVEGTIFAYQGNTNNCAVCGLDEFAILLYDGNKPGIGMLDSGGGTGWGIYQDGNNGSLAIATASLTSLLTNQVTIATTGVVTIGLDGTATTNGMCHSGANLDAGSDTTGDLVVCSGAPADIAEWYEGKEAAEAGDLVSTSNETFTYQATQTNPSTGEILPEKQTATIAKVEKTNKAYQNNLLGVVSTSPYQTFGSDIRDQGQNPLPVALVGRAPVKVSAENGPISAGDLITSSSTPGVAMRATKAGRVVGVALESFACRPGGSETTDRTSDSIASLQNDTACQGKILVFVNPSFYLGLNLASNGSLASTNDPSTSSGQAGQTTNASVNCQLSIVNCSMLNPDGTLQAQYSGQILTAEQIQRLVKEQVLSEVEGLVAEEVARQMANATIDQRLTNAQIESPTPATDSATPEATNSALAFEASAQEDQLAAQTNQTLDELNTLLSTVNLELSTLRVTGNTQLAQTQVAGSLSQDGTLIIDYGRQINVLGSTLYLQNDPLAGQLSIDNGAPTILIDIGAGTATIDKGGNLKTRGTLTATEIQTEKVTITTSDKPTVGSAMIAADSSQVTVQTAAVEPGSKILVTPTGPTGGKTLYIASKVDFENFTVALDPALPTTSPIHFDWLIIGSKQLSGN